MVISMANASYINGKWVQGSSDTILESINPYNGQILARIHENTIEDTKLAIQAAKHSFYIDRTWRDMDVLERSDILLKIANRMEESFDEISRIESLDNGKPLRESQGDVDDAIHCFRYYAGLIRAPQGEIYSVNSNFGKMRSYTVHEPVGVCALVTPWNYPFLMGVWKLAPALAAGNSIVFKPSSETVLSIIKLFEIFDEFLPAGVANLIIGPGSTIGNELALSKDVDMISFTGSTSVGQSIMRNAAINVKKIGLELGGKSPNIIFEDADLERAVEWAMIGIFFNQGQVCSAGSRIIVQKSIHGKFVSLLKEKAEKITLGNPLDNPDMGPLVSQKQMNQVLDYIEIGKKEGATLVTGGIRCIEGDCKDGFFVCPTIFDDCTCDMRIVREEIFGPVVTILTFETEAEAIEIANDTDYGLAGAVFTNDLTRAHRVIGEIRAGITWINCYNPAFSEAPWGGYKMSGIGRELGSHGLDEYQESKQVNINLSTQPLGWYQ